MFRSAFSVRGHRTIAAVVGVLALTLGLIVGMSTDSDAVGGARVTVVNATGETLWIGSGVNADGSVPLVDLPKLAVGQRATINIPYGAQPHWRGRIFARQRCTGQEGVSFHCLVGDCGKFEKRCEFGAEPTSLAEFNFDDKDPMNAAPWYNVSYVDAVSLGVTIDTPGANRPAVSGTCVRMSCSGGQMLAACPRDPLVAKYDPANGELINCVNPDRDRNPCAEGQARSYDGRDICYINKMRVFNPRAYLYSVHDREPGNLTMYNCPQCADLVVTFRNSGTAVQEAPQPVRTTAPPGGVFKEKRTPEQQGPAPVAGSFSIRGVDGAYHDKCVNVPWANPADGAQMRIWYCHPLPAMTFTNGANGSLVVLGKCLSVAGGSRNDGADVRLEPCGNGPGQTWEHNGKTLRNPHSGKCLDAMTEELPETARLQIWTCNPNGQVNQTWRLVKS